MRKTGALATASAAALLALLACQSPITDADLTGTWTNDDDPSISMTLLPDPGGAIAPPADFPGTLVGELQSPDSQGRLLLDVRRDALLKPLFTIPSFASAGVKDILCEGCDVSSGRMACDQALATAIDSTTGAVVSVGRSCHWTKTAAPRACSAVTVSGACALLGCPTFSGAACAGGFCQEGATCTWQSRCQCQAGTQLACCDGTACPPTGCVACSGGSLDFGCAPSPPLACSDDVSGASGACACADGRTLAFACGAAGTCEARCSGALVEGGFGEGSSPDASMPAPDASGSPCGPQNCAGCCRAGVCYAGTATNACGVGGGACASCGAGSGCSAGSCS